MGSLAKIEWRRWFDELLGDGVEVPPVLVIMAIMAGGVGLAAYAARFVRLGSQSRSWPHTTGVVTRSETRVRPGGEGEPESLLDIRYRAEGEACVGSCVAFNSLDPPAKEYPIGTQVRVYYCPGKPHRSVLRPGVEPWPVFVLFVGLLLVGVPLVVLVL